MDKLKILIVGQGAKVQALAKNLVKNPQVEKIYIAPGNGFNCDFYKNVDIRESCTDELLKFVIDNKINLTVPLSKIALKEDIVGFFQANGQPIFGPTAQAGQIFFDEVLGKKFLYNNHVQIPRFFVTDKISGTNDFLQNCNFPIVIKSETNAIICNTINIAQKNLMDFFNEFTSNILIEEFVYGKNFTIYFITDGYSVVPITSCENIIFDKNGNLTSEIGCFTPNLSVSEIVLSRVSKIANSIIAHLEKKRNPYMGIIGINGFLTGDDKFYINNLTPIFSDVDTSAILNAMDGSFLDIIQSCINGFFSDEFESFNINNKFSASVLAYSKQKNLSVENYFEDYENIEFMDYKSGKFVITKNSSTLKRAKELVEEELDKDLFDYINISSLREN